MRKILRPNYVDATQKRDPGLPRLGIFRPRAFEQAANIELAQGHFGWVPS